jgi:hypothetical protein
MWITYCIADLIFPVLSIYDFASPREKLKHNKFRPLSMLSMPKPKIHAPKRSSFESQEKLKEINYRKESDTKILPD